MFDFECQMRFWKCATDAAFGYASATMAAVTVLADQAQEQMAGGASQSASASAAAPFSFDAFNPFALPFQWLGPQQPSNPFSPFGTGVMTGAMPNFFSAFFPFAPQLAPVAPVWNPFTFASSPASAFFTTPSFLSNPLLNNPWQSPWTEMMRSYGWAWPQPSWTMWQHPMTAALMAAGMPYSVASPTARANASAMDAADAARDGFNKAFSSYHSDGGHAAAHTAPKPTDMPVDIMSMMMAPWMAFVPHPQPG